MSRITSRTPLFKGWSSIDQVAVRHNDGTIWQRTLEYHGDAAAALPFDPERRTCLMVSMPRIPLIEAAEADLLEAPAGMLDEGEDAETCARREAMEEAGVRLGDLEFVTRIWTMPGLSNERVSIFLAPYGVADRVSAGGGVPHENEQITTVELGLSTLQTMVQQGRLLDGKTLIAAQALILRRPDLFADLPSDDR
ncbi:NUDIX hydrolase [Caulobacter sp. BE254]|uniref:NUDIX hydrolase n=1 Tax=Caulobacter sp. BE254 TaxID=2817720 RepID=UPI00285498DF|nr:NUDIX hydrolase [Caulobacter sp. BE254]MDR7117312.1 nudix-type nucleoside diphosphatase (YffH/AdpP family) [Caulobacter sp. BE254]